jgi:hypothetical protein
MACWKNRFQGHFIMNVKHNFIFYASLKLQCNHCNYVRKSKWEHLILYCNNCNYVRESKMRTIKVGLFQKEKGKPVIIYFLLFCLLILEARM